MALPRHTAEQIVEQFMNNELIRKVTPPDARAEWEQLGPAGQKTWEHTEWLNSRNIDEGLREVYFDKEESQLVDPPDIPIARRNQSLLRRRAPFVAMVNSKTELKYLVERDAVLEKFAVYLLEHLESMASSAEDRSKRE